LAHPPFEIETPLGRKRAWRHFQWIDHAVLRYKWTNFDKVADGVYRSNHPNHQRLEAFRDMGGKSILSLRGGQNLPPYLFEAESCAELGLGLHLVGLSARKPPEKSALLNLLDAFETLPKPFLMHCKSGADRTGLAASLYLMIYEGRSVAEVKEQLSWKYIHIRRSRTGVLDHFLRVYAARNAQSPISVQDWIAQEYDRDAFAQDYEDYRAGLKLWTGWR